MARLTCDKLTIATSKSELHSRVDFSLHKNRAQIKAKSLAARSKCFESQIIFYGFLKEKSRDQFDERKIKIATFDLHMVFVESRFCYLRTLALLFLLFRFSHHKEEKKNAAKIKTVAKTKPEENEEFND